jgi:hypothetical protein
MSPELVRTFPYQVYISHDQYLVRIWDTSFLKTGNAFPPTSIEPPILKAEYRPMAGHISDLAWDGESKRIILVGESREKFGAAIQMETGTGAGEISGHSKIINAIAIRHQRPFKAVTASDDTTIVFHSGQICSLSS